MPYCPILGTLGYVLSPDKTQTLMIHRISRKDDHHFGKYNGLGGKMEPDEDIYTCMIREAKEEAGIDCTSLTLRGTINWTGFGPNGENWLGFIFCINTFTGNPWKEGPEGPLEWVPVDSLLTLPMWEGDRHFIPLVFDNDPRPFHGFMPYQNGTCLSWSYRR
ncbi:MAG: 8-oxo-dGTP diphosphatase [Chlamydiia bacterium]|nr:8-oxo-dGTP diphosphatase [Chlamydiia bacterium]